MILDSKQQCYTLIERKSRVPQLQEELLSNIDSDASSREAGASKGEAVVAYRKPLATQKMGRHRLSRRVNKMGFKNGHLQLIYRRVKNCFQIMNNHRKMIKLEDYPILFTII